jgi:hypothetical protein
LGARGPGGAERRGDPAAPRPGAAGLERRGAEQRREIDAGAIEQCAGERADHRVGGTAGPSERGEFGKFPDLDQRFAAAFEGFARGVGADAAGSERGGGGEAILGEAAKVGGAGTPLLFGDATAVLTAGALSSGVK